MSFCLHNVASEALKTAIRKGEISPEKLSELDSQGRRDLFAKYIGQDAAKETNLLFEKKLLLKNQERAMYDFAREATGMSKADKEATLEKIRQAHEDKNRRLYEPTERESFLNEITSDIYSKKYGTDVSLDEAQKITELARDTKLAKDALTEGYTKEKGLQFGASKVALDKVTLELISFAKLKASSVLRSLPTRRSWILLPSSNAVAKFTRKATSPSLTAKPSANDSSEPLPV